jgi:hypothetical protein
MTRRSWIRNLFARTPRSARHNLAGYRPRLEALEERLAPALLTPSQVRQAYGIDQISFGKTPGTGAGQTIAIIDYGDDAAMLDSMDPNFSTSDLATFDAKTGLSDPPSFKVVGETGGARPSYIGIKNITESDPSAPQTATVTTTSPHGLSVGDTVTIAEAMVSGLNSYDGQYKVTSVPSATSFTYTAQVSGLGTATGGTINNPVNTRETALDVEWAHAMAPQANILLIETQAFQTAGLINAANTAVTKGASVVSMSFGGPEFSGETTSYANNWDDALFQHAGVSYVAGSGDSGEPGAYPAFSPNVLAVGATNLDLNRDGSYLGEVGWIGSGGGVSQFESQPAYQQGTVTKVTQSTTQRTSPDVSFVGGTATPVEIWDSLYDAGSFVSASGTSLSAPCWAGLTAIADQGLALQNPSLPPLNSSATGFTGQQTLQTLLYDAPLPFFHDIIYGNNGSSAGTGYDLVTGIGTPVANLLIPYLGGFAPLSLSTGSTILDATSNGTPTGTAGEAVYDTTTLSGAMAGVPLTGTVTYTLYPSADGTGTPISTQTVTVNDDGTVPNSLSTGPLAAGSYSYIAVYSGNRFYQKSTSAVEPLTINPPTPTLSPASLPDATYGGTYSQSITATELGYQGSFTFFSWNLPIWLSLSSTGQLLGNPHVDVGTYTFSITATDSSFVTGSQTYSVTVDKANLTITAANESKTYGTTFLPDGTSQFTASGLVSGDTISSVTLASSGYAATATVTSPGPNYPITPTAALGTGVGNYTITYVSGTLTVNPRPLTIIAANSSKTYGAAITLLPGLLGGGVGLGATSLVNGDSISGVTLTSAGTAGTATVTSPGPNYPLIPSAATGSGLGNYSITYVNGIFRVDPAPLTITATNQSKTYGAAVTPAGTEFTTGAGQLLNGDTVTSVTLSSSGYAATATVTTPGPNYSITPSAALGTGVGNYTITYASGTLTVNPRPLTITASNISKTYGEAIVLWPPAFSVGGGGLVNGDSINGTLMSETSAGGDATAAATNYPIAISGAQFWGGAAVAGNYSITYVNGTLTVNPRPLTITAPNSGKLYGETIVLLAFNFGGFSVGATTTSPPTGLVNGDLVYGATLTSAGADATAAPGPYPIDISAASLVNLSTGGAAVAANYSITYVSGTLTVNPLTAANLQAVLASTSSVTLAVATTSDAQTALTAVNGLTPPASPVTITINLASGSFTDLTATPPKGVTLVLNGNGTTTTIVGQSPALQVPPAQGSVVVTNVKFTTATDAPTILVSGGSLTLRNVVIEESTGFTDAAISITGGSLDLGTTTSSGGNTLNVNGTGEFVHNTTGSSIPASGDTFAVNGVAISAPYLSFTSLASSGTTTAYGQAVTLTASVRANTTPGSGSPSGKVDFFDVSTNTDLGSVSLSGGSAALPTAALGVGQHVIRATYSGDGNFTVSLDALTQTVTLAPLTASPANVNATAGAPFSGTVATFATPDTADGAGAFTATILWGDGSSSSGIVKGSAGSFTISGSHTYADPKGSPGYAVSVQISNPNTKSGNANDTATVTSLGQAVVKGLTGGIGFWHNQNGQALIQSFGSTATGLTLANWLAATFPNLYGANTGSNNLSGKSNAQVAAYFLTLFNLGGTQVQAQVLAMALNIYATTASLGGSASAAADGFSVSATGLGADSFSVGSDGAAFGVANNTSRNVYELLLAVNQQAVNGGLYGGNTTLQASAADLFNSLSKAGSIG